MSDADTHHLARALALAERGRGGTRPNPLVGCVIVREDTAVGEGWHTRAGGAHAEVKALEAAGGAAQGATAYVSLEPCAHTGRTGPCAEALIEAGVGRVVYGLADPSPVAAGGHDRLEAAGVEVTGGLLADWVAVQNERFVVNARSGRPHVTLKLAQTVDGALHLPAQRWVTGVGARHSVHRLRARVDAVMVGSGTVIADDPRLDVRHVDAPAGQPRPVVVDARGRTPTDATVVRPGAVVVTTDSSEVAWRRAVVAGGAEIAVVPPARGGGVSLPHALRRLREVGVSSLLAEGGATVSRSLVSERLVDRLVLHVALGRAAAAAPPQMPPCVAPGPGWRWCVERAAPVGSDRTVECVPTATPATTRVA